MGCSLGAQPDVANASGPQPQQASSSSSPGAAFKMRRGLTLEKGLGDDDEGHSFASRDSSGSGETKNPLTEFTGARSNVLVMTSPSFFGTQKSSGLRRAATGVLEGADLTIIRGIQGVSMKGSKAGPNQDCYCAVRTNDISIYIVCDGHGKLGHEVSNFVKDRFPPILLQDERIGSTPQKMKALMTDAFKIMTDLIDEAYRSGRLDASKSGTTSTVVVHDHRQKTLTVGHVGDSGATIAKGTSLKATYLTPDHKPNLPRERRRIEATGGSVNYDGYNYRVSKRNSYGPQLNMSRSFGDLWGREAGIISVPDTMQVKLKGNEQILLLCSDGVWEFLNEQDAANIVREGMKIDKETAARALACAASDKWTEQDIGTVDDITVLLIFLQQIEERSFEEPLSGTESTRVRKSGLKRSDSSVSQATNASTGASPRVKKGILKRSASSCSDGSASGTDVSLDVDPTAVRNAIRNSRRQPNVDMAAVMQSNDSLAEDSARTKGSGQGDRLSSGSGHHVNFDVQQAENFQLDAWEVSGHQMPSVPRTIPLFPTIAYLGREGLKQSQILRQQQKLQQQPLLH